MGLSKGTWSGGAAFGTGLAARRAILRASAAMVCAGLAGCAAIPTPLTEPMRLGRVASDGRLMFADQEPIRGPVEACWCPYGLSGVLRRCPYRSSSTNGTHLNCPSRALDSMCR